MEPLLTALVHLYNLIPYQRRARHAGQGGVEVEDGPRFAARHRSVVDCTGGFWLYPSGGGAGCGGAVRRRIGVESGVLTTSSFERQPKLGMTARALGTLARA